MERTRPGAGESLGTAARTPAAAPARAGSTDAIVLRDVVKVLGGRQVLKGLTMSVATGSVVALMGPSGVGKTVTVKHVLGLYQPDRGDVLVEGRSLPHMTSEEVARMTVERVGAMLQGGGLFASSTLHENIAFALRQTGVDKKEVDDRVRSSLAEVGLEPHALKRPPELSVGMRTRAALARALATTAPIIVLDDFEAGLDPVRASLLCELVERVQAERRCTILVTTHSVDLAARLGDVLAVMAGGRIVACGPPAELMRGDDGLRPHEAGLQLPADAPRLPPDGRLPPEDALPPPNGAVPPPDNAFVQDFLRGDPRLREELRRDSTDLDQELDPLEGSPRDTIRLVVLALTAVLMVGFAVYWLLPVLRGDSNLNPYIF